MNKSELIEALAEKTNMPIREAGSITNTLIETMTDALVNGESIEIRGFGSFVYYPSAIPRWRADASVCRYPKWQIRIHR